MLTGEKHASDEVLDYKIPWTGDDGHQPDFTACAMSGRRTF